MCVNKAANILNLPGNGFGITAFSALKRHMFQHMSNTMFLIGFVSASSRNPNANRHAISMGHFRAGDCQAA
jgi:hypothetical protein